MNRHVTARDEPVTSMDGNIDCILVTAANNQYCGSLLAMLRSLRKIIFPVAVFDLGLSTEDRARISSLCPQGCTIFDPGWCVPLKDIESTPNYKKVFLAKPYIPRLIPGYSKYVWIDADIWFQDASAIDDYLAASETLGAAIGYEDHPSYKRGGLASLLRRLGLWKKEYKAKRMQQYFGSDVARKWSRGATLNSGIFCFNADSEIWAHWQSAISEANLDGQERKRLICDQTCLDLAIERERLKVKKMPATHNWCLGLSFPMSKGKPARFFDPIPPHLPIKVLHATGDSKASNDLWPTRCPRAYL